MIAWSDGQEWHKKSSHRTGIVAIIKVTVAIVTVDSKRRLDLSKQTTQEAGVARSGKLANAEMTASDMVYHEPSVAHAF